MKYLIFTVLVLLTGLSEFVCAQMQQQPPRRMSGLSSSAPPAFFPFRKKANKEQKKQLQPKAEDLTKYAQFLAQPNTGMFRLLPDAGCEENSLVVRADEKCLQAIPESSFYSFREEEHTSGILADIRLKNGFLVSDGILSQGILVNLGDVAIDKISLTSDGLPFLRDYQPQESNREAQKQHLLISNGIKAGKYEYRRIQSAVENSTYALRVIAYRGNIFRSFRGWNYDLLDGDRRVDLTLAFRVVRKEKDGSVTLLWKQLERRESPKLKFNRKKEKRNER